MTCAGRFVADRPQNGGSHRRGATPAARSQPQSTRSTSLASRSRWNPMEPCSLRQGLDWICVSPKVGAELVLRSGNELKLVFPQEGGDPELYRDLAFDHFLLQPMDGPARERNTRLALEYCLRHPEWRLSLQTHKCWAFPDPMSTSHGYSDRISHAFAFAAKHLPPRARRGSGALHLTQPANVAVILPATAATKSPSSPAS